MSKHAPTRVELTDERDMHVNAATGTEASPLGRGTWELEKRITPLVVIAIIAVLIGLLLPAVH